MTNLYLCVDGANDNAICHRPVTRVLTTETRFGEQIMYRCDDHAEMFRQAATQPGCAWRITRDEPYNSTENEVT